MSEFAEEAYDDPGLQRQEEFCKRISAACEHMVGEWPDLTVVEIIGCLRLVAATYEHENYTRMRASGEDEEETFGDGDEWKGAN